MKYYSSFAAFLFLYNIANAQLSTISIVGNHVGFHKSSNLLMLLDLKNDLTFVISYSGEAPEEEIAKPGK